MSHYSKKDVQEPLLYDGGEEMEAAKAPADDGTLTRQQINQCMMDIEDMHPLMNKVRKQHILPCLRHCTGPPKPEFTAQLRIAMLAELGLKLPKTEKKVNKNPFLLLGYGVNSYFDILEQMMKMFAFITIAFIPIMAIYAGNRQDELAKLGGMANMGSALSMGNLGGAQVYCHQNELIFKTIALQCPVGRIMSQGNVKYGVISNQFTNKFQCTAEDITETVKIQSKLFTTANPYVDCSKYMDTVKLNATINNSCNNKTKCQLQLTNDDVYKSEYLESQYKNTDALTGTDTKQKSFNAGVCGEKAAFFIQYPCLVPETQKSTRQIYGLFIGCCTVFIYLFVLVYLDYIKCVQMNEYVEYDVDTITAGDYTVCFDLEEDTYKKFSDVYADELNPMCENAQFKLYLQNELESRINAMNDLEFREEQFRGEPIKIAQITFAYENGWIIDKLKKRGGFICAEKYDKLELINEEIHTKITSDANFLDKIQLPCAVFVTFEDEEGHERALIYNDQPQMKLLGEDILIQEAAEPTDIIWENREYSPNSRKCKTCIAWLVILIMLTCSFLIIFTLSVIGNNSMSVFPANANCAAVEKQWNTLMKERQQFYLFNDVAVLQYANHKGELKPLYTNVWPCFCQQTTHLTMKGEKTAFSSDIKFSLRGPNKKDAKGDLVKPANICNIYHGIMYKGLFINSSISFVIIAINIVLKMIITALLTWVKEATKSEMLGSITNGVFIVLFLNTGLLLTIANANLTEHPPHFITNIFHGPYYDYDPMWYSNVGFIILKTMCINACMPFVQLGMGWGLPFLHRKMDMKWGKDRYVTKKTSMAAYKKVWSGGEYVMHVKESGILLIVFVTCMYGVGMPLLFPIATLNFAIQYVAERYMSCFQVKLPPSLDDKLTNNLISMMKWAPLIMLFNGYWMLSNKQIFDNGWSYMPNSEPQTHMKSGHFITLQVNWAIPMLLMAFSAIFLVLFIRFCPNYIRMRLGFSLQEKEIKVDEDLPNFFDTILLNQADEIVIEEKNLKTYFGFECNDPDTVDRLDNCKQPSKSMIGTPWYTVLSNDAYKEDFCYIGADVDEREKLIEDGRNVDMKNMSEEDLRIRCEQSDLVIILLNISCIPDCVVKKIPNFKHGWQKQFLQLMENYKANTFKGENFEYQNAYWEEQYASFVKEKQSKDQMFQDHKREHESACNTFTQKEELKKQNSSVGIN